MKGRSIQIPMLISAFFKAKFRHLVKKIKMAMRILQSCHILKKNPQLESPYLDNKFQHATKHITRNPYIF
jgi:hypothetical protein